MPTGGMRSCGRKLLETREVTREGSADGDGTGNGLSTMSTPVALETFSFLAAQNNHLGQCKGIGMRDRHQRRKPAHRREPPRGPAVQRELRRAAAPDDLDVAPQHPVRMPGAERLHRRFFRGKPAGKVNRWNLAAGAVGHFALGEHAPQEPLAVSLDRVGDAGNIRGVEAEPENVRHATASD